MNAIRTIGLAGALALGVTAADAQTLRIAMTTSDVPTTGGIPDNGSEGGRFAGYPIYDALVNWDYTRTDEPSDLTPGLATAWRIDPQDSKRWIFTLRQGVTFHDGSPFTADSVLWNLDRHLKQDSPHYDRAQAASYRTYTGQIAKYEKISETEVAITTKTPFSMFPYLISRVFLVSPAQYAKAGNWLAFQAAPSGTGPFKVERVTRLTSIELARNADYWDRTRVPKVARMVLLPIPDANTRVAALRSGQVDWIEFPLPDSIPSLKAAGFQIVTKPYLHVWSWRFNTTANSPARDVRVRRALNYGIDRESMVELLGGTATPAIGIYASDHKFFGKPTQRYGYDPAKAKALLAEAGYGPGRPLTMRVHLPTAGSGNMVPVPMAEFVQQSLAEIGVNVQYEIADWGTVLQSMRIAPGTDGTPHRDAINHGQPFGDPTNLYNNVVSTLAPPNGGNWGFYKNEKVDQLLTRAFETFDQAEQDKLIAEAHALVVDDAQRLFIVHDLNPRALSPKVRGFVQAQSWYQDFTQVRLVD